MYSDYTRVVTINGFKASKLVKENCDSTVPQCLGFQVPGSLIHKIAIKMKFAYPHTQKLGVPEPLLKINSY